MFVVVSPVFQLKSKELITYLQCCLILNSQRIPDISFDGCPTLKDVSFDGCPTLPNVQHILKR